MSTQGEPVHKHLLRYVPCGKLFIDVAKMKISRHTVVGKIIDVGLNAVARGVIHVPTFFSLVWSVETWLHKEIKDSTDKILADS